MSVLKINYINDDAFNYISSIKDSSIDSVISDIPYGINFNEKNIPNTKWDYFSNDEYIYFLEKFFNEMYRVCKNDSIMFIFVAPTKIIDILNCNNKWTFLSDFYLHYCRSKGRGAKYKLKSLREDILCFCKGNATPDISNLENFNLYYKQKVKKPIGEALDIYSGSLIKQYSILDKSFYVKPPIYNSKVEKQIHSCQKPILLLIQLILLSSKKGDTILDPFMGSGSTGISSFISNRNFIGIELDKEMYNKAKQWKDNFIISNKKLEFYIDN